MAAEVFISYSHYEKAIAERVCAELESEGIRCWYAPRDIEQGADWSQSIINAINSAKVMVVIITEQSIDSQQVLNEAACAVDAGVPIIPFKLTDTTPSKEMEYLISSDHCLNAVNEPLDKTIPELCRLVRSCLSSPSAVPEYIPEEFPVNKNNIKKSAGRKKHLVLLLILIAVIVIGAVCFMQQGGVPPFPTHTMTLTNTPTQTNTWTPTMTLTATSTDTPAPTATDTPVPTDTAVPTDTDTPEPTDTAVPTDTATPTATDTPVPTDTATPTATDTATPTATDTASPTDTATPTATDTSTPTNTATPTDTATPTITLTPTNTFTPTVTPTPTNTPVPLMAGDIFRIGQLKQDDSRNIASDVIEWEVLDVQDEKVLLVSRNLPDSIIPEDISDAEDNPEESKLIKWLNEDFLLSAFSPADIRQIIPDADGSRLILLNNDQEDNAFRPAFWLSLTAQMEETSEMTANSGIARIRPDYLEPGDEILFGTFEENFNPGDDAEPVIWQVLEKEGDTALLISKYILTKKPFLDEDQTGFVPWSGSSIRSWLNEEFYDRSFDADEKSMIIGSPLIEADPEQNGETEFVSDKVFLISQEEAENYFSSDEQRICSLIAFDPRDKSQVYFFEDMEWLLSSVSGENINYVSKTGEILSDNVHKNYGIRPALRIDLSKTEWIDVPAEKNREIYHLNIRDPFTFGHYEQDDNLYNGSEPLEWLVLDKKGDKVLLISKYTPDVKPWNESIETNDLDWSESSLQHWLNSEFLQNAFTAEEQQRIVSEPKNKDWGDGPVSMLSSAQVRKYFPLITQRVCYTTQYARTHGAYQGSLYALWWTRDPDPENDGFVLYVDQFGNFRNNFPYMPPIGVRPVIWFSLR